MSESVGDFQEWLQIAQSAEDPKTDTARPRFYIRPFHLKKKSEIEGRPIFEDREYVEIVIPGQPKNIVDCQVTDQHKRRWPKSYAAFKAGQSAPINGTPLEQWAYLTKSQVEVYKQLGFRSVEDIAQASDSAKSAMGIGANEIQKRAIQFLQGSGETEKQLRAALDEQTKENKNLQAQMAQLASRLDEIEKAKPKKAEKEPKAA